MALIDLTKVDPYGPQVEAQARAQQASANMWTSISQQISQGIQAGQKRRAALEERNMAIRDREYALANQATDKLVQAKSNHKYTDQQLQQVGQKFKQEFYDAVKEYEQSDKGDEARQKFETVKQRSLGSARTLGDSIDKLGESMDAFMDQAKNGGISDSMNPAVRSFFADLNNPELPADHYQIVTDEATGQLKYQGKTSDGHPVDFFLEDIANGENQFAPVAKVDMPKLVQNLMQGVPDITKKVKQDWGTAEVTDWGTIGDTLSGRMDDMFKDEDNFRSIAAGLGYGYEELEKAKNGEAFADEQEEGEEINSIDTLKDAVKRELLQQMEVLIPHKNNTIQINQQEQANQEVITQSVNQAQGFQEVLGGNDFTQFENKQATVKGLKGNIHTVENKNGKVTIKVRSGQKGGAQKTFDTTDPKQLASLYATLYGIDYTQAAAGLQQLNRINQDLSDISLN